MDEYDLLYQLPTTQSPDIHLAFLSNHSFYVRSKFQEQLTAIP